MKNKIHESLATVCKEIERCHASLLMLKKKRQRFDVERKKQILYLKKGSVVVYRKHDNVLSNAIVAPAILGLPQMMSDDKTHYFRCESDCEMWSLPVDAASALFDEKNLWRHAFEILTYTIHQYYRREYMITQKNAHGVVVQHLKYIWSMSKEIREKTSIYTFILQRNHISRSSINKIVSDLKKAGLIDVCRGKLIAFSIE